MALIWRAAVVVAVVLLGLAAYVIVQSLEFLNRNTGALTTLFTGTVAISTAVYAILTRSLVKETQRMRAAQTEPKLWVTIQPREEWINFIDMIIQNIGLGPAYDITFQVTPDFEYMPSRFLSQLGFMKGLKYLGPGQKLQFFLSSMVENAEQKIKTVLEVHVAYRNRAGKPYDERFVIDFSVLAGMHQLGEPPLHKISKNVEKMSRHIENAANDLARLRKMFEKRDE